MGVVDGWGDVFTNGDIKYPQACKLSNTYVLLSYLNPKHNSIHTLFESTLQATSVNQYLLRGFLQAGLSSACPEASAPSCMDGGRWVDGMTSRQKSLQWKSFRVTLGFVD